MLEEVAGEEGELEVGEVGDGEGGPLHPFSCKVHSLGPGLAQGTLAASTVHKTVQNEVVTLVNTWWKLLQCSHTGGKNTLEFMGEMCTARPQKNRHCSGLFIVLNAYPARPNMLEAQQM